ncbi:MAG TPA: hypothetical protein VMF06_07700 [Candidatus Limnocylindria bacterium]|nr:hypothetical protein [Candidatus Limnocylindria bacterium]
MDHLAYQSRRATPDDVPALQALWQKAELPWNELESYIDEFVVVPGPEGVLIGALGIMVEGIEALLHSEALMVVEDADEVREAMWKRVQNLARAGGAKRVWTQEDALFWQTLGFTKATPAIVTEAKASFLEQTGDWLVFPLFNPEKAQEIIREHMAVWETQRIEAVSEYKNRTRLIKQVLWIVFGVMVAIAVIWFWVFTQRNPRFLPDLIDKMRS